MSPTTLSLVEEGGVRIVESAPDQPLMTQASDAGLVIEACFSHRARLALLYAPNLTGKFFDLSSAKLAKSCRSCGITACVSPSCARQARSSSAADLERCSPKSIFGGTFVCSRRELTRASGC